MGNKAITPIVYAVELPGQEQPKNSTKVWRSPESVKFLQTSTSRRFRTMKEMLEFSFKEFRNNRCLGT